MRSVSETFGILVGLAIAAIALLWITLLPSVGVLWLMGWLS